jgi:small subunit ribosomal protein S16
VLTISLLLPARVKTSKPPNKTPPVKLSTILNVLLQKRKFVIIQSTKHQSLEPTYKPLLILSSVLKIKLSRTGKRNQPYYRIVVAEKRSKLTGQYIDLLGNYDPNDPKNKLTIDKKRYADWITKGAKPTDTVRQLVAKQK